MRHGNHKYKLGVDPAHRKSMIRNLASEVIDHGKIKTTVVKAKATKIFLEKLITLAKNDSVANRRLAYQKLDNKAAVSKLFTDVAPKFKERPGGYTRIIRVADARVGDGSKMGFLALVD